MPPKKKEEVKEKPILGRFRTNLKVRSRSQRRLAAAPQALPGDPQHSPACLHRRNGGSQ